MSGSGRHPHVHVDTNLHTPTPTQTQAGETHFFDQGIQMRRLQTDPRSLARAYADYFAVAAKHANANANATLEEKEEEKEGVAPPSSLPFGFDTTPSLLSWRGPVAWCVRTPSQVNSSLPPQLTPPRTSTRQHHQQSTQAAIPRPPEGEADRAGARSRGALRERPTDVPLFHGGGAGQGGAVSRGRGDGRVLEAAGGRGGGEWAWEEGVEDDVAAAPAPEGDVHGGWAWAGLPGLPAS